MHRDGRRFERTLTAITREAGEAGERIEVRSPGVGLWRDAPRVGDVITPGASLGALEILGVIHPLIAPPSARGTVMGLPPGPRLARRAVSHAELLLTLDPRAISTGASDAAAAAARGASGAPVFRAPMGGRYYARPAPDAAPFVSVGDVIEPGQTIAILEVMKTFNRVQYAAGTALPERARVLAILPKDGDDVSSSDPLLELEPA
jgi:acetyl-CoA carboxylase biotin carboxyl carrier protein